MKPHLLKQLWPKRSARQLSESGLSIYTATGSSEIRRMWGLARIIYDSDGYILTNNHVIEGAMSSASKILPNASIEVILPNQADTPYEAVVIGRMWRPIWQY